MSHTKDNSYSVWLSCANTEYIFSMTIHIFINIQTWMEKAWPRNQLVVSGQVVLYKNSRTKEFRGTGEGRWQKKPEDNPPLQHDPCQQQRFCSCVLDCYGLHLNSFVSRIVLLYHFLHHWNRFLGFLLNWYVSCLSKLLSIVFWQRLPSLSSKVWLCGEYLCNSISPSLYLTKAANSLKWRWCEWALASCMSPLTRQLRGNLVGSGQRSLLK